MTLVIGLGCQRGCDLHTLLALFDSALAEGGIERHRITALASIDRKSDVGFVAQAVLKRRQLLGAETLQRQVQPLGQSQ